MKASARVPSAPSALLFAALVLSSAVAASAQSGLVLENGRLRAEFDERSLVRLTDLALDRTISFKGDGAAVALEGRVLGGDLLKNPEIRTEPSRLTFGYSVPAFTVDVVYELRPGWRFLSKHVVLTPTTSSPFRVLRVDALAAAIDPVPGGELALKKGTFGVCLRFGPDAAPGRPSLGMFALLQNPYMEWKREGGQVAVSYAPAMDWRPDDGPFATDRLCLGLYEPSGATFPATAVPEWKFVPDPAAAFAAMPAIDAAEVDAITECVRAFLLYRPGKSVRVHVPWTENDYQIDVATPEGWDEYKRIMDRAVELGCGDMLFTGANGRLSRLEDNADEWGWENLLFFALGQKIRMGQWDPRIDAVPAELRSMLDYAASKNLGLMAYAYPSLPFKQDPAWTAWANGKPGVYACADTGLRSFQDWWIATLQAFMTKTGAAGFSFDHWWIAMDGAATSKYAQWFGARRVLETLRRRAPKVVVDGRQQYQNFGPWTWLAGTYPHPTLTDEQPESFHAFPDLHTDRVSADRQRFAAWTYRVERFCPPEILPGYITHQTERSDAAGVMRRDRFRPRDWDVLGWRYSLLSSIATAPFNHVVDFIPARDPEEYKAFSAEDIAWFRKWLDWTDKNAEYLRFSKPVLGPPMVGRADGWSAINGDRGFLFLFNPNPGEVEARVRLDASVGLIAGDRFLLREIHPFEGRMVGSPAGGAWSRGEEAVLRLPGAEALFLEVFPAPAKLEFPVVFEALGQATLKAGRLAVTGLGAETGTERAVRILVPAGERVRSFRIDGRPYPFQKTGDLVTARIRFAGAPFGRLQRIGPANPYFTGGSFKSTFRVPARVVRQLEARRKSWPVTYTPDDLLATWLGPWRLLLFVGIAEPDDTMAVTMTIDGKPAAVKKAYNSIYPRDADRTFLGFYADLSGIRPDADHSIEVVLPSIAAGRFLGLFFENVETEYTADIAPAAAPAAKRPAPKKPSSKR